MPVLRPRNAPPFFHILTKPTGAICNLDCKYCFFLSKEALYPDSRFRMTDEVLEAYVRQMIEGQSAPQIVIAFQGGEPTLMGLDFFRRAVEYAKKYAPPGAQLEYSLQTNGTLLNEAWCDFFRDNNFLIGLSLDGPRAMHDAYRVDKGGGPTFDKVMRAARLMQERQVEFNILCTVHAMNASHPLELYRFFRDEVKTQFIQFIPIVERATQETLDVANEGWGDRQRAAGAKGDDRSTLRPEAWSPSARSVRSNGANSSSPSLTSGCAATWAPCSCRCSMPPSPHGSARRRRSASSARRAATRWRWSITATSTRVIIMSSRTSCWATSCRTT